MHKLRQQLIRNNDELTDTAQHRSQLQNEVFSLQKLHRRESRELSCLEHREAQTCLQWNLAMADKDGEIAVLSDQIQSLTRDLALDQAELDLLAESEGGLMELSKNINITTEQAKTCGNCGDSVSSRLEGISSQLSALTRVVLGLDTPEEEESYRAGTGHPEHINIRHLPDFRAKSVMRELECGLSESTEEDVEISVGEDDQDSSRSPSRSPSDSLAELDIRGGFSTSIMIERNSQDEITNIFRRDNSASPDAIFSRDTSVCYASPARVTCLEVSHVSTQTEPEPEVSCDKCDLGSRRLAEICSKLEEAKFKNDEQMTEICLLSRRVDQLQHQKSKGSSSVVTSGKSSFIIKDLQGQVQQLEERNVKKDSLIRKLAEEIIRNPGVSVHQVVATLTSGTVKPSDRRIDFDMESLARFLEKRRTSVGPEKTPGPTAEPSVLCVSFTERIRTRM